jgi:hypothetical protein
LAQEDKHTGIREPESPDSSFPESRGPFLRCFKSLTFAIVYAKNNCSRQDRKPMTEEKDAAPLHSAPEEKDGRKPAIQKQGGAPAFLASRRQGFSKGMKKFNKKHCNNRFGK